VSASYISIELRRLVAERAGLQCEYCQLPAGVAFFPHEVDHVVAAKHGGLAEAANLAFACWRCNRRKGTDLGSLDPETGVFSLLFNPRAQEWSAHFAFQAWQILGLTPEGRTTVNFLKLNSEDRLAERRRLLAAK